MKKIFKRIKESDYFTKYAIQLGVFSVALILSIVNSILLPIAFNKFSIFNTAITVILIIVEFIYLEFYKATYYKQWIELTLLIVNFVKFLFGLFTFAGFGILNFNNQVILYPLFIGLISFFGSCYCINFGIKPAIRLYAYIFLNVRDNDYTYSKPKKTKKTNYSIHSSKNNDYSDVIEVEVRDKK